MTGLDELSINVRGLKKTYVMGDREVRALAGVDLSIESPGYYAVMGASGSGKSTLLHLLAGLDRADEGSIRVAGVDVHQLREHELTLYRRHAIGVVFQQFNLLPTMTALENVILPGVLDGMPEKEQLERGRQLLEELGLAERMNHRPDALSGGEQQRVAIARSLFFRPGILLADEPTGNLDSATSAQLWDMLANLARERRMIVLMVTHEMEAASQCERVFVFSDGRNAGHVDVGEHDSSMLATRAAELARST